jgi:CHAT domain-containing protein
MSVLPRPRRLVARVADALVIPLCAIFLSLSLAAWPARAASTLDQAYQLQDQAVALEGDAKYAEAIAILQRVLAAREKGLGPTHRDVATTLWVLGRNCKELGRFADAESSLTRAMVIYEGGLKSKSTASLNLPLLASVVRELGDVYVQTSRVAEAEPLYKRALDLSVQAAGDDFGVNVADSLDALVGFYVTQGRFDDADPLVKRELAVMAVYGRNSPDARFARAMFRVADVYVAEGRPADAEMLYKRVLELNQQQQKPNSSDLAYALSKLAGFYLDTGRYSEAEPIAQRALSTDQASGAADEYIAFDLGLVASIDRKLGRYADARPLLMRSLAIREAASGQDSRPVANTLNGLGALDYNEGRYADAEPLYQRAIAIDEKLGFDAYVERDNLAKLYLSEKRYADALAVEQPVLEKARATPAIALPVLFNAQQAGAISPDAALDQALDVAQRAGKSSAAAAVTKLGVRLAARGDRLATLVRQDQDLAAEAQALEKALVAATAQGDAKRDAQAEQQVKDRHAAIGKERAALQKTLATEFPDYSALSNPLPLSAKEIQALLAPTEAFVLFAPGDTESYVFAVTRDSAQWKAIPLGADDIARKVAEFRIGLDVEKVGAGNETAGRSGLFDLGVAYEFYTELFGPVEPLVKQQKQLIIVPSGALTALPFHLLVTEKPVAAIPKRISDYRNAAWLIKRQAVNVLPSAGSLKVLRAFAAGRDRGRKPLVGFGNPVFNPDRVISGGGRAAATKSASRSLVSGSYTDFWQGAGIDAAKLAQSLPQLPDTADELNAIAKDLGVDPTDVHLGSDASETTVKRLPLADYRIVYFATHGLVAGDVQGFAEPSLALSIPKQPTELDDGLLTASEITQLKLNADWVVLSACNTIAGDKPGAEALSGLARAFFYAGARALLVSHWAVDSAAATRLTTSTFDLLEKDPKLGRADGLRQAMLDYLNDDSSPDNAYPAIWGPFALVGEGAALQN